MLNKIYRSDAFIISVLTTLSYVLIYFFKVNALIAGEKDMSTYQTIWNGIALKASLHHTLTHPWTLLSYLFYTDDFVVLLVDLFWLWTFGSVLEKYKGERSVLPVFLIGGIIGALFFVLFPAPRLTFYMGMPAGLVAVALAAFLSRPDYVFEVYQIKIPLWLLTLFFFSAKLLTIHSFTWHYAALLFGGVVTALAYRFLIPSFFHFISKGLHRFEELFSNKRFIRTKD